MDRLRNRVVLITGAGQGIGEAIARQFARENAIVNAIDRNQSSVSTVCDDIEKQGGRAKPYPFDITDQEAYRRCVQDVHRTHGRVDVLVNNAGIEYYATILSDSIEQWDQTQAVNLKAVYWGCKLVAPIMVQQKRGWIINISSVQAMMTQGEAGAYCASKGGVISFTKSLAVELAPHGILANAIAPGCIHTPMSIVDGVDETTTEHFETWYVKHRKIPLARPGEAVEVARAAVFLASDDCSYITGHTLVVDGGLSITF